MSVLQKRHTAAWLKKLEIMKPYYSELNTIPLDEVTYADKVLWKCPSYSHTYKRVVNIAEKRGYDDCPVCNLQIRNSNILDTTHICIYKTDMKYYLCRLSTGSVIAVSAEDIIDHIQKGCNVLGMYVVDNQLQFYNYLSDLTKHKLTYAMKYIKSIFLKSLDDSEEMQHVLTLFRLKIGLTAIKLAEYLSSVLGFEFMLKVEEPKESEELFEEEITEQKDESGVFKEVKRTTENLKKVDKVRPYYSKLNTFSLDTVAYQDQVLWQCKQYNHTFKLGLYSAIKTDLACPVCAFHYKTISANTYICIGRTDKSWYLCKLEDGVVISIPTECITAFIDRGKNILGVGITNGQLNFYDYFSDCNTPKLNKIINTIKALYIKPTNASSEMNTIVENYKKALSYPAVMLAQYLLAVFNITNDFSHLVKKEEKKEIKAVEGLDILNKKGYSIQVENIELHDARYSSLNIRPITEVGQYEKVFWNCKSHNHLFQRSIHSLVNYTGRVSSCPICNTIPSEAKGICYVAIARDDLGVYILSLPTGVLGYITNEVILDIMQKGTNFWGIGYANNVLHCYDYLSSLNKEYKAQFRLYLKSIQITVAHNSPEELMLARGLLLSLEGHIYDLVNFIAKGLK